MAANKRVIHSWEVKPLVMGEGKYESRMLLDNIVAGEPTVQINEGTVKGGQRAGGGHHEKTEIYYIVKGEGVMILGEERSDVAQGSLVVIPGGVFHEIVNKSETEDLVLLTFWMDANDNEVYLERMKLWGKAFKTIYED